MVFQKKQQLKEQISGNNLIGIYASLLAGIKYVQFPNPVFYSSDGDRQFLKSQYQYSTLNLGWQRRFNKHGFLHLQIGTGIQRTPQKIIELVSHNGPFQINPLPKWRWISSYKIGVGLALNNSRTSTIEKNIWTYHKVDNDMWKVDLFGFVYSLNKEGVSGKINIGYEKSIQQSSFSIATNLLFHQQVHPGRYKQNQLSIQIAPRYYYNLKKRMRRGKTANDLSAEYFSIRNQWNIHDEHWIRRRYKLSILWGIQRRVFEKMYINYELGRIIPFNTSEYIFLDETISELKIGLAF